MTTEIVIEGLPRTLSLNEWQRAHWATRHGWKKQARTLVFYDMMRQGIPATTRLEELGHRSVTITRHSASVLDHDNFVGGCKPLLDALVANRVIRDDSPEWVQVTYRQAKAPRGKGSTTVVVTWEGEG